MNRLLLAGSFISVLLFSGCAGQNSNTVVKAPVIEEPKWLDDPHFEGDEIAAVGCARRHFKGEAEQKKLAMSRAIEQIAMQVNTKVSSVTHRTKEVRNSGMVSSKASSSSVYEVDGVNVSTKVKGTYKKPYGEMCIWVVKR